MSPVNTAYISDGTTVLSNLSLTGSLTIANQTWVSSGMSTSKLTVNSVSFLGGAPFSLSVSSFNVVAHVVQGSASSFTVCATVTGVQKGDILCISPLGGAGVSSVSSGLVYHSHCTQNGQFEFRYSNVSTLAQNQSAQTYNIAMIRLA